MSELKITDTPFYQKLSYNLITLALLGALLYLGQGILVPLFFSILLATLLLPVTNRLQQWRVPKVISIIVSIIVTLAVVAGILYFLSSQVSNFLEDIDTIKKRLVDLLHKAQEWINATFNISERKQQEYIKETTNNLKDSGAGIVGQTVLTITESLAYVVFIPVYTFLMLFYKDLIKRFLINVFKNGSEEKVRTVLEESRTIGQQYVLGLLTDMVIVFALNTVGFLILGIKYAVFLALVGALMNLIPYIGMLIANVFCMLITMVSSENLSDVLWVAIILAVVQIIDNNLLIPMIVGNKVRINALVTIVGVVVGGALCGIAGMFLAIPGIAVMKVVFDHVDSLKPWGMLLGDEVSDKKKKGKKPIR
ncbi:AI-2E family transporter [Pseudochryseolinea flava]|uniref:AI-2E family transporter n=1 Tax=Pseudochryseolinea flava TaxID=2059302 RepID=A0A364XXF4_9BACT|nr:AI-2E family transporter [Pseudochryseolinea flava]RAV99124.1 AI-2E family transporter [Pseudochryseolinea flava]